MNPHPPKNLVDFQEAYSRYLRAPQRQELPLGVPAERSLVYERLLLNNVCGFIDKCFPVARCLVDTEQWLQLSQQFFGQWQCESPIFSQIPHQFAEFVADRSEQLGAAPWLAELLHYEWLELAVDLDESHVTQVPVAAKAEHVLSVNPSLQLHEYQWPVHRLCADYIPSTADPVILAVYRTYQLDVRFMEVNAVTAMLIQLLQQRNQSAADVLDALAAQLPHLEPQNIHHFGRDLIERLVQVNVLLTDAADEGCNGI